MPVNSFCADAIHKTMSLVIVREEAYQGNPMLEFCVFVGFVYSSVFLIHEALHFRLNLLFGIATFTEVVDFCDKRLIGHDWNNAAVIFDYQVSC